MMCARGALNMGLLAFLASARGQISFSAGFTDDTVLQRGAFSVAVYGFSDGAVTLSVSGVDGAGDSVAYSVDAALLPWEGGQWGPEHGSTVWRASLRPNAVAGGAFTLTASNSTGNALSIANVTWGDVFFCSGQR